MSVLDTEQVDFVYLDERTATPVIVVSDPLTWRPPEDEDHLEALRTKLNAQIAFVERGRSRAYGQATPAAWSRWR